jgi:hypothetical protein
MEQILTAACFSQGPYTLISAGHWGILAYLDPGSGSYLIQLLVAAALGGLLLLRLYWQRVKSFVRRVFTGKDERPDADE